MSAKRQDGRKVTKSELSSSLDFVYHFTCLSMPSNEIFVSRLLKYHQGEIILTKENLFGYIIDLCNQFKHFALCLEEFLGLPKNDQRRLLYHNTPIYVQFVLALYFNGETGYHQLQRLPNVDPSSGENYSKVNKNTYASLLPFKSGCLLTVSSF